MKTSTHGLLNVRFIFSMFAGILITGNLAAQMASWTLGSNANATTGPGITATMSLGAGVTDVGYGQHYSGGCTGRIIRNWTGASTSIATAIAGDKYIEFAISPSGGQTLVINSFRFSMSAGFTTNGTGAGSMALRFSKTGSFSSFLRHPSACSAELVYAANNGNNGSCATYTFNSGSSGSCTGNPWPISVASGETLRFRIYIITTQSATTWRTTIGNVSINGANPLPVNLSAFTASCEDPGRTKIRWTTQSEQNAQKFTVQKSMDLVRWDVVSEVDAAGNSNSELHYEAEDFHSESDIMYYRLIQTDFNGLENEYDPVSVSCDPAENGLVVYPNPSNGHFTVGILSPGEMKDAQIVLADLSGKVISVREIDVVGGKTSVFFDEMNLAAGSYMVRLVSGQYEMKPVKLIIGG